MPGPGNTPSVQPQARWYSLSTWLLPLATILAAVITAFVVWKVAAGVQSELVRVQQEFEQQSVDHEVRRELTNGLVRSTYRVLARADDLQALSGSGFPAEQRKEVVEAFNQAQEFWQVEIRTVRVVMENYYGPTSYQHNQYLMDKLENLQRIVERHLSCLEKVYANPTLQSCVGVPRRAVDAELGLITGQMYERDLSGSGANSS